VSARGSVSITFVNAEKFANGIKFSAVYTEDLIWLNRGKNGKPTDGFGLDASNTEPARFIKQNPQN